MHQFHNFPVEDIDDFKQKVLAISNHVEYFCFLDSNNYPNYPHSTFGSLFAIDAIERIELKEADIPTLNLLQEFIDLHQAWMFGFLNYDLKNKIEITLQSNGIDEIQNDLLFFFIPKYIIRIQEKNVEIGVRDREDIYAFNKLLNNIHKITTRKKNSSIYLENRISKEKYMEIITNIRKNIRNGNIYELNYCQEFYATNVEIDTLNVFENLNQISKAPFSCFLKNKHQYLMCASPERFLKKQNKTLVSQPIKGTRKRAKNTKEDNRIKQELFFNEKERSENVMIVDLVRNDMSKIAEKNSVEVEELFGLYSFEQVHQLISTISCTVNDDIPFTEIIKAMFPMGSMTGAPKIAAMQLIEHYELTKRGLFSGAVGYITPKGNFDFNVIIRSILYNTTRQYLSIQTGSAITIDAEPEKEYDECLVKAEAMIKSLNNQL